MELIHKKLDYIINHFQTKVNDIPDIFTKGVEGDVRGYELGYRRGCEEAVIWLDIIKVLTEPVDLDELVQQYDEPFSGAMV